MLWGSLKNTDLITSFWAGTFSNYVLYVHQKQLLNKEQTLIVLSLPAT